jgi:methylase of polypeptide subunit release factors
MTAQTPTDDIRVEDALGVCGVREDTQLLAEVAAQRTQGPGRALDLGAGSGYVAIALARLGWDVDAVDISERALEAARRNAGLNGVTPRIYRSDLFGSVEGCFDVIACNPPMRPDETEGSRLVTATLRRAPPVANLLMRVTQPFLERNRLDFLAHLASAAAPHLAPGGRLLLVISPQETAALPGRVAALRLAGSEPVAGIPGLQVATFIFDPPGDSGQCDDSEAQ